jgi:hypothetical protein
MKSFASETGMLADTPVGMAMFRATDAATAYLKQHSFTNPLADEMAYASTSLCMLVLDLLTELEYITE